MITQTEKLWTRSFISACTGNFLLFFAFYLLIPIFPLYLIEEFHASKTMAGLVLSAYTLSALAIRPVAGFLLDLFNRRPLYLAAYIGFVLIFISYPLLSLVNLFLLFRILHGLTFGFVTTAGSTLVVDILPPSKRGKGLSFFGVANNMAMVFGPMTSLYMHGKFSYTLIFIIAVASGLIGFVFASMIKAPRMADKPKEKAVALDRFFLVKGFKAGVSLFSIGVPYGMLMTFLAVYGMELGINSGLGMFFTVMAIGLVSSRLISGNMIDQGKLNQAISWGLGISALGMIALASLGKVEEFYPNYLMPLFYTIPLILGLGYGLTFPAYNTLFVNLAPNNRRATASSTFMTSWDLGVGTGTILGGKIADSYGGLPTAYLFGGLMVVFAYIYFQLVAGPHFIKNKLR